MAGGSLFWRGKASDGTYKESDGSCKASDGSCKASDGTCKASDGSYQIEKRNENDQRWITSCNIKKQKKCHFVYTLTLFNYFQIYSIFHLFNNVTQSNRELWINWFWDTRETLTWLYRIKWR